MIKFYHLPFLLTLLICFNLSAQENSPQILKTDQQDTTLVSTLDKSQPSEGFEPSEGSIVSSLDSLIEDSRKEPSSQNQDVNKTGIALKDLIYIGVFLVALATLFFRIYSRRKSVHHTKEIEEAKLEVQEKYEKKLEKLRLEQTKKEELAKLEAATEHKKTAFC